MTALETLLGKMNPEDKKTLQEAMQAAKPEPKDTPLPTLVSATTDKDGNLVLVLRLCEARLSSTQKTTIICTTSGYSQTGLLTADKRPIAVSVTAIIPNK